MINGCFEGVKGEVEDLTQELKDRGHIVRMIEA